MPILGIISSGITNSKSGPAAINWTFAATGFNVNSYISANGAIPLQVNYTNGNLVMRNTNYTSINTTLYYLSDVTTSTTMTSGTAYPVSYEAHSGGQIGSTYYFAGGYSDAYWGTGQTAMYSYTVSGNSYTSKSAAPATTAQNNMSAQHGTKMYSMFGSKYTTSNNFYYYSENSWTSLTNAPVSTGRTQCINYVSTGDKCVLQQDVDGKTYVYTVGSNTWGSGITPPISYQSHNSACDGVDAAYLSDSSNGYKFTVSTASYGSANAITNANGSTTYQASYYKTSGKLYYPTAQKQSG